MICPRCKSQCQPEANFCPVCGTNMVSPENKEMDRHPTMEDSLLKEPGYLGKRFEVLKHIGSGGMGIVVKAKDNELDEIVALKILKPELAQSEESLLRFKREIKIARKIKHPNVCGIYDFLILENKYVISMEYIEGTDLAKLIRDDEVTEQAILPLVVGTAMALKAAHDQNVVHRDLKPANILIDTDFRPIVTDFGIARYIGSPGITLQTNIVGTPSYMAPEQFKGAVLDQKIDIYSLGIIMYELHTGSLPFPGENPLEIGYKHIHNPVIPPRVINNDLDIEMENIILKCLQKNPADRYGTIREFIQDIKRYRMGSAATAPRLSKPLILVVDDDEETRKLIMKIMTLQGYELMSAGNGEEAVEQALQRKPDLILMDLMMPKMDGCRAAEILGKDSKSSDIPILLVTSIDNREYKAYSRAIGVKEYITKPFQIPELIEKVKFHLELTRLSGKYA